MNKFVAVVLLCVDDTGDDIDDDDGDGVRVFLSVIFPVLPTLWWSSSFCRDDEVLLFGSFRPLLTGNRPPCSPPSGAAVVFVIIVGTVVAVAAAAPTSAVVVLYSSVEGTLVVWLGEDGTIVAAAVLAERTDDDDVDDELVFKKPLLNPNDDDADFCLDFVFVPFEDGWISLRVVI